MMSTSSARFARPAARTGSRLVLAATFFAAAALVGACDRGDFGRGAQTTTTSTSLTPRPEATVNTSHTVDNAGFVDNGGRTSDETSRTEFSGMRATETGSERPTGSPGEGIPLPIEPRIVRPADERAQPRIAVSPALDAATAPAQTGGSVSVDGVARLARARCDRETSCNRVGANRPWKTQDSCVDKGRERARTDIASLNCEHGVDGGQLGICLNALRALRCNDVATSLDRVPQCEASALCSR